MYFIFLYFQLGMEKIFGLTVVHRAAVSYLPSTGDWAYAAGCMIVFYNAKRNKQVRHAS